MLAILKMNLTSNRRFTYLCMAAAAAVLYCAAALAAGPEPMGAEQAKAKLAAVRARIAALTGRLGGELKERDALSSRLREAELLITAKRQRLDALRAEKTAAERHRTELRGEQAATINGLQAERADLGRQVRAAYMIGRQEQLK